MTLNMAKPDDRMGPNGNASVDETRLASVMARDASCDGGFVYAVKTTGIYCKPSCPSRRARASNIVFYSSAEEAEQAGFRACQRCRPNEPGNARIADLIIRACRLTESSEALPKLDALAKSLGISAAHFHRLFKAATGLTPKAYGTAHRSEKIRDQLAARDGKVTDAIYEAGFGSGSRFYERSNQLLGMTPSAYRSGGEGTSIRFALGECSLGSILVACSDKGVCAISLGDDPDALLRVFQAWFPKAELLGGDPAFETMVAKIIAFVETPERGLDLPLDIQGTAFQQRVWQALCAIPSGETKTYAQIAEQIGAPKAVRAVAGACAANKIAVAIPCHRVVRTDGNLSGYRWGIERKRALLLKEKR